MKKLMISVQKNLMVAALVLMTLLLPVGLLPMMGMNTVSASSSNVLCCVIPNNPERFEEKWGGLFNKESTDKVMANVDKNKNFKEYTVEDFKQLAKNVKANSVIVVKINDPVPANALYSVINWELQYIDVNKNDVHSFNVGFLTSNDAQ